MELDFETLPPRSRDKLMLATIVPRPIALVTSIDAAGRINAGPFSYFQGVAPEPPLLAIMVQLDHERNSKDTARNIRETGEFTVNLVNEAMAPAMNVTSISYPPEVDELAEAGLTPAPAVKVTPPRIAESPASFECRLYADNPVGPGHAMLVGEIVQMHLKDEYLANAERLHVATEKMGLIARMHGAGWYARTTDLFEMKRPSLASVQHRPNSPESSGDS